MRSLSAAIKSALDQATGLDFSPIIGLGDGALPHASYSLTTLRRAAVSSGTLEIRILHDDYDALEKLRFQIETAFCADDKSPGRLSGGFLLYPKISGGGVLPVEFGEPVLFDSTQYITLTWVRKE